MSGRELQAASAAGTTQALRLAALAKLGKPLHSYTSKLIPTAAAKTADEIFTLDEVSAYLKAGKRTVYRLAQNGKIPAFKLGGAWRFRRSELDRWIADGIAAARKKNTTPR